MRMDQIGVRPNSIVLGTQAFRIKWDEDDEGLLCYVPVPGYNEDNLEVKIEKEYIVICGDSKVFPINVSLLIPTKTHTDDIHCGLENGLLTIYFPMRNLSRSSSRNLL